MLLLLLQMSVHDLLRQTCAVEPESDAAIVVYDQCTRTPENLPSDRFLRILFNKLSAVFADVALLQG
jgi:hypothetical protein